MAEELPTPSRAVTPASTGGKGFLTQKMAGLPTWGWLAIAGAAGVVAFLWIQRSRKATDTSGDTADSNSDTSTNAGYSSDVDQSLLAQIRDLQGQGSTTTPATTTNQLPAPASLKFTSVTRTNAIATWAPVDGAVSYNAYWQTKAGTAKNVPLAPINNHGYKLNKGDTVNLRVCGVSSDGTEGLGTTITAQVP